MDRRHAAGALLALAVCIASSNAAPTSSNQTSLDLYEGAAEGCYYNFQHYGEGDRIMTNEPCLNCTCHNRMLMCYLRVCPFTKPIGQDCSVEKRADQCCPIVTCPDVPVDLLTSTSTTSPAEYGATGVGKLDKYGCSIEGKYFPEGSKVPPTPNKPCEHCYCIRNMTTCVMQECTLHVDGCTPIYHKDVCCPVRYSCDHDEDEVLLLDDMTTTVRPTPGFLLTTTTISPVTQMSQDCVHDDQIVPDGALIKTEKACEHCYCMKGDIVCVVQECGTPMENEGKNCTSQPPKEGQCCPDTYICEGDEVTTELSSDISTQSSVLDDLTTLSPSRRPEGSDYRKETDEAYTEKSPLPIELEGSGYDQTTISSFETSTRLTTDEEGSGFESSTLPPVSLTDNVIPEKDTEKEYSTPSIIDAADKDTTMLHELSTQSIPVHDVTTERNENEVYHTTDSATKDIEQSTSKISDTRATEQGEGDYARTTTPRSDAVDTDVITTIKYDSVHKDTITPSIDISDKETTDEKESGYKLATTVKTTDIDKVTSEIQDSHIDHTIAPVTLDSVDEITKHEIDEPPTTSKIDDDESTSKKDDGEITTPISIGVSDEKSTGQPSEEYEQKTTPSITPDDESITEKQDIIYDHTSTSGIGVPGKETTEQKESDIEHTTAEEPGITTDITSEKYDLPISEASTTQFDYEVRTTPKTKLEDESVTEKDDSKYEQTTLPIMDTDDSKFIEQNQEKGDEKTTPPTFISHDETTISSSIGDKDITKKQDIDYESSTLPSSDISVKDKEEQDSQDEKTTMANIDVFSKDATEDGHDATTLHSTDVSDHTSIPNIDIRMSEKPDIDQKETTPQNISPSDHATTQKQDSEFEHTTLPYIEMSDKVTEDKQHEYDGTTLSNTIPDETTSEKEKEEATTHKQDIGDKETTLSSTDESNKDTSRPSEKEAEGTTLPSTSIFEKDTTEKIDTKDERTTIPDIDLSTKETTEKDESTTSLYEKEERVTTIPTTDISDKDVSQTHVSEEERTTLSSITDVSNKDIIEKQDNEIELTTVSSFPTPKEETDYDSTSLPKIDVSSDTKYELPSTIGIPAEDSVDKHTTEPTKETTDESLPYVTSTGRIPTLDDVERTTEPDKGLNTVPHEIIYDDDSKLMTTEKTDIDVKEPAHSINDKDIIPSAPTTPASEEETVPVDQTPILETYTPSIDENEVKDITTQTPYKPIAETPEDIANQVKNYSRIPGEGDCLLNGITYSNNSEVPKSNNCHTRCKCISSIIKCDPILCSPPPKYMDNCQPIYDTPDSCCPTYVCQSRETIPPQPDSHVSVTEKPSTSSKEKCNGEKCDEEVTSKTPSISDCGPSGCGVTPQPSKCADGECSSHIPLVPTQPCEGNDCNIEPVITPIKDSPLCQDGQNCQPQSSECIGTTCDNIDATNIVVPPKDDSCKDNKDCHKEEHDISTQCTEESCRRKDTGLSESQSPTVCSGSECTQYKPDSEVIPSTVSPIQKNTETNTDRISVEPEIQTRSPETVTDEHKSPVTGAPEISNELPTSETKPSSEVTETSDLITTIAQDVNTEKSEEATQRTTLESVVMTTISPELSITQGTDQKEPTDLKDADKVDEVTKSPDVIKETVMTEQSVTKSPDISITTSDETDIVDDQTYITKSPTIEHPTDMESFVTESQDITTKSYDDEHIVPESTHSTEAPKVTKLELSTSEEPLEVSTEKLESHVTELQDGSTTKTEDDQNVEISTTSKIQIDDEVSDVTTQTIAENKDTTTHISDSFEKVTTEPTKDSEFEIESTSTEMPKIEISTQETDLKTDSDLLVIPTTKDDDKIEGKPMIETSTLTPITEEITDTKITKPLEDTITPSTEKHVEPNVMGTSEPIAPVTGITDYITTISAVTEQAIKVTPEANMESTIGDEDKTTEISVSHITKSSISDITEPSVSDMTEPSVSDITKPAVFDIKEPSASHITEPSVSDITKPSVSEITEPSVSHITEPSISDITEPSISDITEPSLSDITEHSVSDITESSVSDITELSLSDITEHSVSDITEPSESDITEPSVSDITESSATKLTEPSVFDVTEHSVLKLTESSLPEKEQTTVGALETDVYETKSTEKTIVEHVTQQETISETQTDEITKPLPDKDIEFTEKSPVTEELQSVTTEKSTTDYQESSTQDTEQKHDIPVDVETTTGPTLQEIEISTESNEIDAGEKSPEVDVNQYTKMPDALYTEKQDVGTKVQGEFEPETVTQSLQTESPTVNIGPDITRTEASLIDHTQDLTSQTTESHDYSTKKPDTSELFTKPDDDTTEHSDEEKYTIAIVTDKEEVPTTESSKLDTNKYETQAIEISTGTVPAGEAATTQFDITTQSEIKTKETVSDVTTEVSFTTHVPEAHKKDQTDVPKVTEVETSVTQAEPTESSHDAGSQLPHEATTHTSQENVIETSTLPDKSGTNINTVDLTEAPIDSTMKQDQELTKEPVQTTDKITTGPKDVVTEITTAATEKNDYYDTSKLPEETLTELPTETGENIKETTTEKIFDTKTEYIEEATHKPHIEVTESIYDTTTTASDETQETDIKTTISPEKKEPESTDSPTTVDTDSRLEKTTEKQDITTVSSQEEVADVAKETHTKLFEHTTEPLLEESDVSEPSQEPARTTESSTESETTPYVVELQEHPHIIHELSTIIPTEFESTTGVPQQLDEVTIGKDDTFSESPSSPPTYDISTTLSNEIIEKSTESSLSTEKLETQPTTKTPDSPEDKHDIEVSSPAHTQTTPEIDHPIEVTDTVIPVQTDKAPVTETLYESTEKTPAEITTTPSKAKPTKPSEILPPTKTPATSKPDIEDDLPTEETPEDSQFPSYSPDLPDYGEEPFGPGTCRYGGKVYVSAQQIPRDDPCDFCFCFRSDIICLQQSCPPPIHGCYEEPIQGFCCPRYECPVAMATTLNVTTTTTTTTTTLPPHFLPHAYKGAAQKRGCVIKGHTYKVGEVVRASSGPCLHCTCGGDGQMKCDPKACTPEPMLRQMIAAAVSSKRRR